MLLLPLRDIVVSVKTWGDGIIVSQNIWIGCTHENARVSFSALSTLGPGLKKLWFQAPKKPDLSGRKTDTIQNFTYTA